MASKAAEKELYPEFPDMIDVVFDLDGVVVPDNYPFLLWAELVRCLPWLNTEEGIGVHPLRGSLSGEELLLSKRTKLILRLPVTRTIQVEQLTGQQLHIAGSVLIVGKSKQRELQAVSTLHAYVIESGVNEVEFIESMEHKLEEMNVSCNLICDKYRSISFDNQIVSGYGLVLHDLKLPASLSIQRTGLGGARHLGCGIFVPFKAITGLD
jgi:CRISPR-associated protein Cas6